MTFPKTVIITNLRLPSDTQPNNGIFARSSSSRSRLSSAVARYSMSSSPPPTALKHCSKPWCKKTVPNGSKFYKACDSCREHDKLNQKARRAALKAGGLQKKVNKRKRAASTSSGGDGSHTLTETTTSDEEQDTTANKTSDTESSGDEGYKPRMVRIHF